MIGELVTRDISFGRMGRGRVWLNDVPKLDLEVGRIHEILVDAPRTRLSRTRVTAAEIYIPHGARSSCGLLGGQFTPDATTNTLAIRVETSRAARTGVMIDALAGAVDQVLPGLPDEYASAVLGVATSANTVLALGSGVLLFREAAHGRVGSSSNVFRRLTSIVVQLMSNETMDWRDEDLLALFDQKQDASCVAQS